MYILRVRLKEGMCKGISYFTHVKEKEINKSNSGSVYITAILQEAFRRSDDCNNVQQIVTKSLKSNSNNLILSL